MERILIVGNGFDLAHNLPTKYYDFLYFCCKRMNKEFSYFPKNVDIFKSINELFENLYGDKFDNNISNNSWINYFIRIYDDNNLSWIDFESEIKNVCTVVSKYERNEIDDLYDKYCEFMDVATLTFNKDGMKNDLNNMIQILDKYLNVVNSINISIYSKDIINFYPTKVISFNYTDTFKKVYDQKIPIEYIHGKLSSRNKNNSIVLGFNSLENNSLDIEFLEYIKYFQMVKKDVTTDIINKIENLSSNEHVESMIFGHSMDITDQNIIKIIIEKSNIVYVMYKDEAQKSSLIKNIISIYGERKFMDLCLLNNKKIKFVKQKDVDGNLEFDDQSISTINCVIHGEKISNEEIQAAILNNHYNVFGIYGCIDLIQKVIDVNNLYSFDKNKLKEMINLIMKYLKDLCSYSDNFLISYKDVCEIINKKLSNNNLDYLAMFLDK